MLDDVDQYEVTLSPRGQITVPATLLEKLGWRPGRLEQTDGGVLLTEIEAPGDAVA